MKVRTRFAPSPTGFLHIGGLRTAAYAYAMAKHNGGDFLLRIEDTDQKREVEGAREKIYEILKTFGLNWDETYIQSERVGTGIYQKAAEKLLADGHAFYCFCKAKSKDEIKEDQEELKIELRDSCRDLSSDEVDKKISAGERPAVRLKVPDDEIVEYEDFVLRKKISWNTKTVDDAMLLKSDGFPTYHLAMPVDDHDMQISHVIRTSEWAPSTPIHILVFKYLGYEMPQIGHPTAILDPSGGKLSKRKGNVSCEQFIAEGYLPEALLNFVILLGWAPKDNRELYTLQEFVENFDPNGFQRANPIFNTGKLDWFNGHYIRAASGQSIAVRLKNFTNRSDEEIQKILPLVKERMVTLKDFDSLTEYFFAKPNISESDLLIFKETYKTDGVDKILEHAISILTQEWDGKYLEVEARKYCSENNIRVGNYFAVLRYLITGSGKTPPLWDVMQVLGKDETLQRLKTV